jgi:small subunit ribosomal protein S24e
MKVNIDNENVNRLLHRTEIRCTIDTGGVTPSRKELIAQIAAKKGVKENLVVIDRIDQEFGKKEAKAYIKVYESEKAAQSIDFAHKIARGTPKPKKEGA